MKNAKRGWPETLFLPVLAQNGVRTCRLRLRSWWPDLACARHWAQSKHFNRHGRPSAKARQCRSAEIHQRRCKLTSKKNPGNDGNLARRKVLEKVVLQKNWPLPRKKAWWCKITECNEHGKPGEFPRKTCKVCQKLSWFVQMTTWRNFYRMVTLTSNAH